MCLVQKKNIHTYEESSLWLKENDSTKQDINDAVSLNICNADEYSIETRQLQHLLWEFILIHMEPFPIKYSHKHTLYSKHNLPLYIQRNHAN